MSDDQDVANRATELLLDVAAGRLAAAREYDTLLYPLIFAWVKRRNRSLASQAARLTGATGQYVPGVPESDLEWIANDVAVHALDRVRANATKFDPARGDGASWALRQAAISYVDVVRNAYGVRRTMSVVPVEDQDLDDLLHRGGGGMDPATVVEQRAALDAVLSALPDQERRVVLLVLHYGFTYAETAEIVFGDASRTKRVDRLLQSGRRRIAAAEQVWRDVTIASVTQSPPAQPSATRSNDSA